MFLKQKQPSYSVVFETPRLAPRVDRTHSTNTRKQSCTNGLALGLSLGFFKPSYLLLFYYYRFYYCCSFIFSCFCNSNKLASICFSPDFKFSHCFNYLFFKFRPIHKTKSGNPSVPLFVRYFILRDRRQ